MFELNDNLEIKKQFFEGSIIYIIDDFYKYPQEVDDYLFGQPNKIPLHKQWEEPSMNGVYFEDRRHQSYSIDSLDIEEVYHFLSDLCGQDPLGDGKEILTNCTRFKRHQFNDYKNCVWWPHTDGGYNGIVYFNDDNKNGTCFYEELVDRPDMPEHYQPWGAKKDFIVIKTLEPKYNRFVFFDGYEFPHGMNICTDRYFGEEYRKNQVFFFDNPKFLKELEELEGKENIEINKNILKNFLEG